MPRIGGQDFTGAELRAYFAANNPGRKPVGQLSAKYVQRIASKQIRGESAGLTVTRQQARRGPAPERPGRPSRPTLSIPRYLRQVFQTDKGRFQAPAPRTRGAWRQALGEFLDLGVDHMKIKGYFLNEDGTRHYFELGKRGGYSPAFLQELVAEHGSWQAAILELLSWRYGEGFGTLEMSSLALRS